jgi:hypothetical protein
VGTFIAAVSFEIFTFISYFSVARRMAGEMAAYRFGLLGFLSISVLYMLGQIGFFAAVYQTMGLSCEQCELWLVDYFYFSAITWTTVGYGDIIPTAYSRVFTGLEAISGYIYMGSFVGLLSSFLFRGDK